MSTLKIPHLQKNPKSKAYSSYSFFGKPYLFFGDYLRNKFKKRIFKLPINAFFSCPNRANGSACIFCSDTGSASPTTFGASTVHDQMQKAINSFERTDVKTSYIAYFQAYTNTWGNVAELQKLYDSAIDFPDVVGLMIGTRPDCITDEIAKLLSQYRRNGFEFWVELGMQSSHDKSLAWLKRGHDNKATIKAILLLASYGIPVCVHIILGIPGESWEDIMQTALLLQTLPIRGIKFHHLHVLRNTELESLYNSGNLRLLDFARYTSIFCDFLERTRQDVVIHRISGDASEDILVAPSWGHEKGTVQKGVEDEFNRRGTWQGILVED